MKIKKEIFLLVVVIIGLSLYLVFHESDRTQYQLPVLPKVASKDFTQLEIQQSEKTIVLHKKDNEWFISPKDYLADIYVINRMIDAIDDLTLTALASESESYNRYDLDDDKKITVKAWAGQTLSRDLEVGKAVPTYQHTFIRIKNDPNVYHAGGNFRNTFEKTAENLRNKTVLSLEKSLIKNLHITKGNTTREFVLKSIPVDPEKDLSDGEKETEPPKTKMEWQSSDNMKINETAIEELLSLLARLNCDTYHPNEIKDDFKNPLCTIEVKGATNAKLSIFNPADEAGSLYPAISSQNDYPFFFPEFRGKDIIEKVDALLKADDNKSH